MRNEIQKICDMRKFFEEHSGASYLFFACIILLFRIFLHWYWYGNETPLVGWVDVLCVLILTAGFMAGDRIRRKNKKHKEKVEELLKNKE